MTNKKPPLREDDILRLADGRLPPDQADPVAACVAQDPTARDAVAAFRDQTHALRTTLDPVLQEPIPGRLLHALDSADRPRLPLAALAASVALVIGLAAGWSAHSVVGRGSDPAQALAQRAALAYSVYAASSNARLDVAAGRRELGDWLLRETGISRSAPSLDDLGFSLIGGRLMMGESAPAAMLLYEDRAKRRLVLYLRQDMHERGPVEPTLRWEGTLTAAYWVSGREGYSVSGPLSARDIETAAKLIRAQFAM